MSCLTATETSEPAEHLKKSCRDQAALVGHAEPPPGTDRDRQRGAELRRMRSDEDVQSMLLHRRYGNVFLMNGKQID